MKNLKNSTDYSECSTTLGERVAKIMECKSLTQEQFATSLNITRTFINLVVNGKKSLSERTIKDICNKYFIEYDWLVYGTGEMFSTGAEVRELIRPLLPDNEFAVNLISSMAEMPLEWWKDMAKLARELRDKTNGNLGL